MTVTDQAVIDFLLSADSVSCARDITDVSPSMTYEDAYAAQFAAKAAQAPTNGVIIGFQASLTSEGAKKFGPPDMPKPYVGTLQLRNWHDRHLPIAVAGRSIMIETEVGIRMAKRLSGTSVTTEEAREAALSMHAALEIVPVTPGLFTCSGQHMIAIHNFGTSVVFGDSTPPAEDLPGRSFELTFDGAVVGSAVAGNSGGDPFAVLAEIANTLGRHGLALEPGMVVMTGSAIAPTPLPEGTRRVEARLGGVGISSAEFTW